MCIQKMLKFVHSPNLLKTSAFPMLFSHAFVVSPSSKFGSLALPGPAKLAVEHQHSGRAPQ